MKPVKCPMLPLGRVSSTCSSLAVFVGKQHVVLQLNHRNDCADSNSESWNNLGAQARPSLAD